MLHPAFKLEPVQVPVHSQKDHELAKSTELDYPLDEDAELGRALVGHEVFGQEQDGASHELDRAQLRAHRDVFFAEISQLELLHVDRHLRPDAF